MSTETSLGVRLDPAAIYPEASLEKALGLRAATFRRARKHGALRFIRRGRSILYRGEWVEEWLAAGREGTATNGGGR